MDFFSRIPFVELLGCELLSCDAGQAQLALTLRDKHFNSHQMGHGGVVMTLLDLAMAHAARSPNQPGHAVSQAVVTIEMKTSFLRPAVGRLLARGSLVHRTATLAFCEGSISGDDGRKILAHATGTFKYLRRLPRHGRNATTDATPGVTPQ